MGGNAARLLGWRAKTPSRSTPGLSKGGEQRTRKVASFDQPQDASVDVTIAATMSTLLVAEAWPETRVVFAADGIPCDDSPVPFWKPISQAAAARGVRPDALARLVVELNEAIRQSPSVSEFGEPI